jgi:hypothetical protein
MFATGLFDVRPLCPYPALHLEDTSYSRNCFQFNICMALPSDIENAWGTAWPDDFEVIDGSQHHEPYRDIAQLLAVPSALGIGQTNMENLRTP